MSGPSVRTAALRWGVWYGIIIGVLGVIQITPGFLAVVSNAGTLLAYHRECAGGGGLPSCAVRFAGVVDGIWALFVSTGFAAFVVTLVLYYRAGRRAARESKRISTGIRAALLACALGLLMVTSINVLVAGAGLHPFLAIDYGTAAARLEPYVILGLYAVASVPTLLVAALVGWMGAVSVWRPRAALRERRPPGLPDPTPYSLLPGAPQPPYPYPYAAATEDDDSSSVPVPSSNSAATE